MSRVPSHLRGIKIKELREMQKRGVAREKQLFTDVMGTRLLASASRPTLKRYFDSLLTSVTIRKPSEDEPSDSEGPVGMDSLRVENTDFVGKRVFSNHSETDRSPLKNGGG